jgi:DNA-binding transcriptional ArsR family regulator
LSLEAALRALAEPRRVAILQLARDQPLSVGDIAAHFDISLQAVSQHLQVLKEAGLMEEERLGTKRLYSVRPEGVEQVREFVEGLWPERLARLKRLAETKAKTQRGG